MKPTLGNGSTRMKLDLSHYSTCLRPAGRSVEETLVAHHRRVARSSYRTREQFSTPHSRIFSDHAAGDSIKTIAKRLNAEHVATPSPHRVQRERPKSAW